MNKKYQPLFESFTLASGLRLKNRLVMAPMTHYSSNPDGTVSDVELPYYKRRSAGVGTVITACVYVMPHGKGFPGEFGIHTDAMLPGLRRLAASIKEKGAAAILQIYHGGRECPPALVPDGDIVAPSAVAAPREGAPVPRALREDEIEAVIRAFGEATRRAIEAGFDGVEIHGANGYLPHQFFSPQANRRDDRWGGSLEKRMALPLALVDEVRSAIDQHADRPFALGYRFTPEEADPAGFTMGDTLALIDELADKPLDYLHASLMDFHSLPRAGVDDLSVPRIKLLLEQLAGRVPLIGVGSLHTADDVLRAYEAGTPLVALGRELIMEPDWVEKVEQGAEQDIRTTLSRGDQDKLVIPDPLWGAITGRPGWFPVVD